MKFKTFGNQELPTFLLLHAGGLSWWSWKPVIEALKEQFYIVTPIIDGHGEDGDTHFMSIEASARTLIEYIEGNLGGRVYGIAGLSLGAQIVLEVLAQRAFIAEYAVIESALVVPIKGIIPLAKVTCHLLYPLIRQKWFSKIQGKALYVPKEFFHLYYQDSLNISKETLINVSISNGSYWIKDSLKHTTTQALVLVGEKELRMMRKSASLIQATLSNSQLTVLKQMGHGALSLKHHGEYVQRLKDFFVSE